MAKKRGRPKKEAREEPVEKQDKELGLETGETSTTENLVEGAELPDATGDADPYKNINGTEEDPDRNFQRDTSDLVEAARLDIEEAMRLPVVRGTYQKESTGKVIEIRINVANTSENRHMVAEFIQGHIVDVRVVHVPKPVSEEVPDKSAENPAQMKLPLDDIPADGKSCLTCGRKFGGRIEAEECKTCPKIENDVIVDMVNWIPNDHDTAPQTEGDGGELPSSPEWGDAKKD